MPKPWNLADDESPEVGWVTRGVIALYGLNGTDVEAAMEGRGRETGVADENAGREYMRAGVSMGVGAGNAGWKLYRAADLAGSGRDAESCASFTCTAFQFTWIYRTVHPSHNETQS